MVDLYDSLTTSNRGQAPVTELPSALESFQRMADQTGALQFARLSEVYNYLRRGKHLVIPDEWKPFVPGPM